MMKLPRWWWISMALWPLTGIPLIAYGFVWFGHLPLTGPSLGGLSKLEIAAAAIAIYHPVILLPFAVLDRAIRNRKHNA